MKKGLKLRVWTPSEDNALRTCMAKFKNATAAAEWAAPKLGRTKASIQQRLSLLKYVTPKYPTRAKKNIEVVKKAVVETPIIETPVVETNVKEQEGVTIPQGFTFDIKPTRAVMYSDHVRLYF
jgi:hypothetical protein